MIEQAAFKFDPQYIGRSMAYNRCGNLSVFHLLGKRPEAAPVSEFIIYSGINGKNTGFYRICSSMVYAICQIHASAVAHDKSVKSPLAAQDVGQEFVIHMIWNSIPFIIRCHNRSCMSPCHCHLERVEMILAEFPFGIIYRSNISSAFRLPVAGKMFQRNGNMMITDKRITPLEAEDRGHAEPRY